MRKLPEGVRKDETRRTESFSQQREIEETDSLDNSDFEIDLIETGMSPPETNKAKSADNTESKNIYCFWSPCSVYNRP